MRDVLLKYSFLPFRYDCVLFVGECLESITGRNPAKDLYKTPKEGDELLKEYGSLEAAITDFLGEPYEGIKDGDVCTLDTNDGQVAAGIVFQGRIVARVKNGLMDYPLERALTVWCT